MEMENAARKLHTFKPVLLGLGLSAMLNKITDDQQPEYDSFLKTPGDEREAQVHLNYDQLFERISTAITKYELEPPLLFAKGHVDRNSLCHTSWNEDQVTLT